jgi:hypothetical protein
VEESVGQPPSSQDLINYLEQLCDYAISIGMTYEQYWYGDPHILVNYYNAELIRQKKRNSEMWIQGAYIYNAIGSLAPILNAFSKDTRARPYLKQPIPLTPKEQEEQEQAKIQKFIDYMMKRVKK